MKRKLSTIIMCVFLSILVGCLYSVQVFADQPTYIKEFKLAYASTIDEAKAALEEEGYTAVDGDFNRGGKQAVAVGYLTTDDKSEAITDVRAMEEKGGYSFTEYEKFIAQQEDAVKNVYDNLQTAIQEFRDNYADENPSALFAYDMMNYYTNDDMQITDEETGEERDMGIGEMFVSEDTTETQFRTLLLQGNVTVIAAIEEYLGIACGTSNWIEQAADCEEIDGSLTKAQSTSAKAIYSTLEQFQDEVNTYESLPVNSDSTDEEIEAFLNDETVTAAQKQAWIAIYPIYETIQNTDYLDGSLYDMFMSDLNASGFTKKLAPLAELMTEGQAATFAYVPLCESIKYAIMDEDSWTDSIEKSTSQTEDLEVISAYTGVDRSIFTPDGIAMTSEAIREQDSSNLGEFGAQKMSTGERNKLIAIAAAGAVVAIIGGVMIAKSESIVATILNITNGVNSGPGPSVVVMEVDSFANSFRHWGSNMFKFVGGLTVAIGTALAAYNLYKLLKEFWSSPEHPKYSQMPRIIVDSTEQDDGSFDYTYYYNARDIDDELGDLNGWNGARWIGLYYTTDTDAGKPITTDYVLKYASATLDSTGGKTYTPVAAFGTQAAYNLNHNGLWDGTIKSDDYVYLYFAQDTSESSTTSSVFSSTGGVAGISAVCGLAVGAIGVYFIDKSKAKKGEEPKTTTSN